MRYNEDTEWKIVFHGAFEEEFYGLPEEVQDRIYALTGLLKAFGPQLGRPKVDTLDGSKHTNMKELRFDADDGVWRVAFAFDPKRQAVLLVGGDKSGAAQKRFYKNLIKKADQRFSDWLDEIGE